MALISRTGSAKDRLYPIKERLFTPQSPHDLPHNQKGEKSRRKNKNHILYLDAHSLYNIWYPWLVLDLQTRNEKRLSCKPFYGSTESIMAVLLSPKTNFFAVKYERTAFLSLQRMVKRKREMPRGVIKFV